jgi:hypothetical protein
VTLAEYRQPFADVILTDEGFSIPDLKWRELVFIGALRAEGDAFVRDPARPLPPFQRDNLFPEGARFRVHREDGRAHLKRL